MALSIQLQRARAAVKAMKLLGFDQDVAKRVLKELLKLYGNNWEYIEAENYRLLADTILDSQEAEDPSQKDASISDELMKPAKRLRHIEDPDSSQSTIEPESYGETVQRKENLVSAEGTLINLRDEINYPAEAQCSYAGKDEAGKVGCSGANDSYGLTQASSIQLAPNKGNDTESFQVPAQLEIANVQKPITTNANIVSNVNISSLTMGESAAESGVLQEDVSKLSTPKDSSKSSQSAGIHHRLARRSFNASLDLVSLETRRTSINVLQASLPVDGESNGMHENCARNFQPLHKNVAIASFPRHVEHDIAKGEERITISVINECNIENKPPYFHYIPQNVIYQNAHVNFSLAQIGEDDCCINCFGNCLSASIPCPCMRETGGEYVYTIDGLLKKEFLNECISMNCYTDKRGVYCKNCPLGSFNCEDKLVACKGHLVRKFIKECWSKCGCNKQCGNRVVQRGITCNLQVFYTADGKGWGLRTLEELPRGAFVCEYVGEILTTRELYDRRYRSAKNTYTLVLDADWSSEEGLRDEQALCLDATSYGNVGRFINHRCFDANLVEVPVQWETSGHHYYHLAYFTTRKVEALEELTWDYGINFKDHAHPMKAFKCLCGSRFCRDSCRSC